MNRIELVFAILSVVGSRPVSLSEVAKKLAQNEGKCRSILRAMRGIGIARKIGDKRGSAYVIDWDRLIAMRPVAGPEPEPEPEPVPEQAKRVRKPRKGAE